MRAGLVSFALALALVALPVSPWSSDSLIGWNTALAGKGGGGGGNGGGGNGGGGNAGGGNAANSPNTTELNKGGGRTETEVLLIEQGVSQAQFTTRIAKRYPTDDVALHEAPHQAITFFTEIRGLAGHIVTHRWIYQGSVEYKADFKIRGATWKAWSSQVLPVEMAGEWTVEIVDDDGAVLTSRSLDYQPFEHLNAEAADG
jgi:hypothetical protein